MKLTPFEIASMIGGCFALAALGFSHLDRWHARRSRRKAYEETAAEWRARGLTPPPPGPGEA